MKKYCAIDIKDSIAVVLELQKNGDIFTLEDSSLVEKTELSAYTKNKKEIYLNIEQEEDIDERVSIDSIIKNRDAIKGSIELKLSDFTANREIMFNYQEVVQNQNSDIHLYQVDGVYKEEYLKELHLVKDISQIRSATISKFSLAGISNMCLDAQSYFSVYTTSNKVVTIAVSNGEILYSRFSRIVASNADLRIINLVADINQTINYVKQQFREIDFSTIAFSGTIAIDDTISEHLYLSISDMNIAILYPNSFIKGIENEEAHSYMLALGSLFVPEKLQFIPEFVKGARQYSIALQSVAIASFLVLSVSAFFALGSYFEYSSEYEEYESAKNTLDLKAKSLKLLSQEELESSLIYIKNQHFNQRYHPVDIFMLLKPVFELQKPENMEWKYSKENFETKFTFKKSFQTLEALYHFEDAFYKTLQEIKTPFVKNSTKASDYAKLLFASTIIIKDAKSAEPPKALKRRRR